MNRVLIGTFCLLLLSAASAQSDCTHVLEALMPVAEHMYSHVEEGNWTAFEGDVETFYPLGKIVLASCLNYTIPETPRTKACLTDVSNIARLVAPVLTNPEDQAALYNLLFQLPGSLSALYSQCIHAPAIQSENDYVTVLLQQKSRESDVYNCLESVMTLAPLFKKLAEDIVSGQTETAINADWNQITLQCDTICTTCGLGKIINFTKPNDIEKCAARVNSVFLVIEKMVKTKIDFSVALQIIQELSKDLPVILKDCGIHF